MNRADYNVGTLENKIEMDIGNAQSALQTLTSSINTLDSALSGLLSNNGLKSILQDVQNLKNETSSIGPLLKNLKDLQLEFSKSGNNQLAKQVKEFTQELYKTEYSQSDEKIKEIRSLIETKLGSNFVEEFNKSLENTKTSRIEKIFNFGDAVKSTIKLGAIFGVLRKGFNTVKDIASANIDMIETTNLFEVQMGKVVDEYGNLDEAQSQYYTKAMAFQDKMNEKLATNKSEMQKYQAMYFGMLNSQLGSNNRNASYLMSESLTKAGYDIASLYNLDVQTAMNKLKSGLAGQIESLRQIGIDVSEASLAKVLNEVGIDRSVQQLSYAEKEIARYIAIVEQAGKAQGDFARTFEQPANQIRVFKNQMIELKQVAGSFFVGLFGQIMPVINGIIMAIKEVLKALGSVFGFEVTSISSLEEVEDTVGDIDSGIGSAIKKAKEFKKQLMGFDEINNITPPSENSGGSGGGTVTGVDSALLNALKEWDNKMDSISGKAQEIRDKILDWLGVTDGSYENLKKILEIAKLVGATIGTWKIASTVSNFLKNWGKLSRTQAFQLTTGITLTITGLVAQFQGTKQLISGNWSLLSLIETALGTAGGALGIVSIMKALKLGTKLNLGQKLAIGFGVMFEFQGLQVAYTAMEDLSKGAIDAKKALTELSIGIGEAIGAGALLGAQFAGLKGALVGGLLGALASGISAFAGWQTEADKAVEKSKEMKKSIEEEAQSWEKLKESIQTQADAQLSEIDYIGLLTDELKKLIDENGNVKKGYEDRVNFILNEVNKAFGTEYSLVEGQIAENGELKDSISEITDEIYKQIEAKKGQILLEANEKLYTEAIQNKTNAYVKYTEALEAQQQAQEDYNKALEEQAYWENYYDQQAPSAVINRIKATNAVSKYKKALDNQNSALKIAEETYTGYSETVIKYEDLSTAMLTGSTEEKIKAIEKYTNTIQTETGKRNITLKEELEMATKDLEIMKKIYSDSGKEITKEEEITMNNRIKLVADKLVEQTNTVEQLTPDQIETWKILAENSEAIYNEKISQVNEDTRLLLETIINTTGKLSPSQIQQWADMAKNSKDQYERNLSGLDITTSQRIQSCVDAINNKQWTAEDAAKALADAVERGVNTINTTEAGAQAVAGVAKGINDNINSWGLIKAASGLASKVTKLFKDNLGIHSPSTVFANLASYIPAGIAKGITDNINKTTKPIEKLANSVTSAFTNNINVPDITKELNQGIKINPKDYEINMNKRINYSAIKGQILAQSQINMNENIADRIAEAVSQSMKNAKVDVNLNAKVQKGIMLETVQQEAIEYTMQTGEPAFNY